MQSTFVLACILAGVRSNGIFTSTRAISGLFDIEENLADNIQVRTLPQSNVLTPPKINDFYTRC